MKTFSNLLWILPVEEALFVETLMEDLQKVSDKDINDDETETTPTYVVPPFVYQQLLDNDDMMLEIEDSTKYEKNQHSTKLRKRHYRKLQQTLQKEKENLVGMKTKLDIFNNSAHFL